MSRGIILAGILAITTSLLAFHLLSVHHESIRQNPVSAQVASSFTMWSSSLGKQYPTPSEKKYRLSIYSKNQELIDSHNSNEKRSFNMSSNQFSDLSEEEFRAKHQSSVKAADLEAVQRESERSASKDSAVAPSLGSGLGQLLDTNIDQIHYLQQYSMSSSNFCNDAYAWVSALAMNTNFYISKQRPISYKFSPQTYIDCSSEYGNEGCSNGSPINSFKYSAEKGIGTLDDYPYSGVQKPCRVTTGFFKNSGYKTITDGKNVDLYNQFMTKKYVIASYVDLSHARFYSGGVFDGQCSNEQVSQAVLIVGVGSDALTGKQYWLLMNTWGQMWGESGKIRIERFVEDGKDKTSCGLSLYASYPTFD